MACLVLKYLQRFAGLVLLVSSMQCMTMPIEEEPPVPNDPPTFSWEDLDPAPLQPISVDLNHPQMLTFGIQSIQDINRDQTLYWRALVNFGDDHYLLEDNEIPPAQERTLSYVLDPCSGFLLPRLRDKNQEHQVYLLIIAVSDDPFVGYRNNADLELMLQTQNHRSVAMAYWELETPAFILDQACQF